VPGALANSLNPAQAATSSLSRSVIFAVAKQTHASAAP
jgi:hypothetical protein